MTGFTEEQIQVLKSLKVDLDKRFTYRLDKDQYGVSEYWEDHSYLKDVIENNAPLIADCEGYAMAIMMMAIRAGFDARLVFCKTEMGEGHCICEVSCKDRTQAYYFDNRIYKIVMLSQLYGYEFLRVSPWNPVQGDQRPWHTVSQ